MLSVRDFEGTALNRTCIRNPALLTLREHEEREWKEYRSQSKGTDCRETLSLGLDMLLHSGTYCGNDYSPKIQPVRLGNFPIGSVNRTGWVIKKKKVRDVKMVGAYAGGCRENRRELGDRYD